MGYCRAVAQAERPASAKALLAADEAKADRALGPLGLGGTVRVQVLDEAASVARRKLGLDWDEIGALLGTVRGLCPVRALTVRLHFRNHVLDR
jgi:predicted nucleic acid-binding protein